jgi:hypothetical protein
MLLIRLKLVLYSPFAPATSKIFSRNTFLF